VVTFRVRVEDLRLGPNVSAGMNPLVLMSLTFRLRTTTDDPEPVVVRPHPQGGLLVVDGRHRFLAAVVAGRPDVLCTEMP
jgi:hypothetical protein